VARSKQNNKTNAELTDAEWAIMRVVWENEPCAAGTVQEALKKTKDWAYSTVKTTMDRMVKKGFLDFKPSPHSKKVSIGLQISERRPMDSLSEMLASSCNKNYL
jgi:predicted transcriptional regulator